MLTTIVIWQVANKKQRDTIAADAEMKARREARGEEETKNGNPDSTEPTGDLLAAEDDDDVIF